MTNYTSEEFWKGAPEGATHYLPESDSCYAMWVISEDGVFHTWLASGDSQWDIDEDFEEEQKHLIPRPIPIWSGDGLPPVGTNCEAYSVLSEEWYLVKIIDHQGSNGSAACRMLTDKLFWSNKFRPIRTQAQIEAEERETAIMAMLCHIPTAISRRGLAEALYDAGYRLVKP